MTSAIKVLALGLALSALNIGCNRENEEEPMTPANATGQPRQVPDSRYDENGPNGYPDGSDGSLHDSSMSPPAPMHAPGHGGSTSHDGTAPPSNDEPTNPGMSPSAPGISPGTTGPGSGVP